MNEKIYTKYLYIKINRWNEVYYLYQKIPYRRFLYIYFITNGKICFRSLDIYFCKIIFSLTPN